MWNWKKKKWYCLYRFLRLRFQQKNAIYSPLPIWVQGERGGIAIWANAKTQGSFPHLARRKRRRKKQYSLTKTKLRKMFIHSQEIPHNIIKHANNNVHLPKNALFAHKITKQLSSRQKNESSPSQGIAGPTRGHLRQWMIIIVIVRLKDKYHHCWLKNMIKRSLWQ